MLRNGIRNRHLLAVDLLFLPLATLFAATIRFEGLAWPDPYPEIIGLYLVGSLPIKIVLLYAFGLYQRLWRFASISELESILLATGLSAACSVVLGGGAACRRSGWRPLRVPLSILALDALLTTAAVALPRLFLRSLGLAPGSDRQPRQAGADRRRRAAGVMLLRQIESHPDLGSSRSDSWTTTRPSSEHRLLACRCSGRCKNVTRDLPGDQCRGSAHRHAQRRRNVVREVVRAARPPGYRPGPCPAFSDIISGRLEPFALREVEIQDLLRREPVKIDLHRMQGLVTERTVLVTGAGGSIGSELCRQVCALEPTRLVLLGHGENSIFGIQQELARHFPHVPVHAVIADVEERRPDGRVRSRRFSPRRCSTRRPTSTCR